MDSDNHHFSCNNKTAYYALHTNRKKYLIKTMNFVL